MSALVLSVVTIRDGRTGEQYDKDAILNGEQPLMTRSKIFFDSNEGDDVEKTEPHDITISAYYDGELDFSIDGDGHVNQEGEHFDLANPGVLDRSAGYAFVLKLTAGGPGGDHTAMVRTTHAGVVSNGIVFEKVD